MADIAKSLVDFDIKDGRKKATRASKTSACLAEGSRIYPCIEDALKNGIMDEELKK